MVDARRRAGLEGHAEREAERLHRRPRSGTQCPGTNREERLLWSAALAHHLDHLQAETRRERSRECRADAHRIDFAGLRA